MAKKKQLLSAVKLIRDHLDLSNADAYCAKTQNKWDGATFVARFDGCPSRAFRVDIPSYLEDRNW